MKVLLVEDMSITRDDDVIIEKDTNNNPAEDVKEIVGLDEKEFVPDFVTVYIVTHEKRSFDVIKQLQNHTPGIPIVVVGDNNKDLYTKLFSYGISNFITEPITFEKLDRVFRDGWKKNSNK